MCTNSLDDDVFINGIMQNYGNPHIMPRSISVFITPDKKRSKPVKISVAVFSKSLTDDKKKKLFKGMFFCKGNDCFWFTHWQTYFRPVSVVNIFCKFLERDQSTAFLSTFTNIIKRIFPKNVIEILLVIWNI